MSAAVPWVMSARDWCDRKMLEPSSYHRLWNSSRPARRPKPSRLMPASAGKALAVILNVVQDPVEELVRWHGRQLLARAQPHADRASLLVAPAGDHHVGHLLGLRLGDLALHLFVAVVQLRTHAGVQQALVQAPKIGHVLIRDRDELGLDGREPH